MSSKKSTAPRAEWVRIGAIGAIALAAFALTYTIATAGAPAADPATAAAPAAAPPAPAAVAPAPATPAESADGVQRITVDTSQGFFSPDVVEAKAGVPIEIAFSQAPGGCLAAVVFPGLDIFEDLTAGPKTIKLAALDAGEYPFTCQMDMVSGTLVVR